MLDIGLICVGSFVLILGAGMGLHSLLFSLRAQQTEGVIVGEAAGHGKQAGGYTPIVQFKGLDGKTIEFKEKVYNGGSGLLEFIGMMLKKLVTRKSLEELVKENNTVTVVYDPANPQRARIKSFTYLYFIPVLLVIVGLGIAGAGIPAVREMFGPFVKSLFSIFDNMPSWLSWLF